ncbi:OLC1v1031666C1 [Oldenlandia corymbosa var. corymbosa]|uniref:OLC1v1031666C1 n=1 Tax=Oldenlandia corymbosa var. corymbosa TaxID=529605 RepID=A0AAV1CJZ1_OLDCO|nr:OLC1v1031666C1 [Oldenlandia corymbosa var. corymbosa]
MSARLRIRNGQLSSFPFKILPSFRLRSFSSQSPNAALGTQDTEPEPKAPALDLVSSSSSGGVVSLNKKITRLIRSGNLVLALEVFEKMPLRTTITWNSILAGFAKEPGKLREAQELFARMPDRDTFSYNLMLSCYLRNGDVEAARNHFDQMPIKDVASWNTMITVYSRNGMMREAKDLFLAMPLKNGVSWNTMISGYVESGDLESALELFRENPVKDVISYTAVVTGCMRSGKVEMAEKFFEEMPVKNLVTWNSMIAGYVENGRGEEGLKMFKTMIEVGIKVNESSLSSILLGCSILSFRKLGKQVHQHVVKSPLYLNTTVGTSLISMYCKCGDLEDACKLFLEMPKKDVVSWNAMISGYAQHGDAEKALGLFDMMRKKGMKPDCVTFVGVLSACNHAGLVDFGIQYFENMQNVYGVKPQPDHYTCMVDLLSRAGKLAEAMGLIKKMSRPHVAVYGTLLGACRNHRNLEVAEFAATNLRALDPNNAAGYVQLANIYAAYNCWEQVSRTRKLMKENRVVKTPGYSWMEIENTVHEFLSGDRMHPELKSIHEKLSELEKKMKLAGYVPHLNSDLHNVGEHQKKQLLLWHSEKLAIAYGLMRLPAGTPIRIFKNLRVCHDCHQATKIISAIEEREIIVRDKSRFHHFKNGLCSCGDYW